MPRSFVIRPFDEKKDSTGRLIDFEYVHARLIGPALQAAGLEGATTGEIVEPGNIREDMFALILEADVVICDVTVHNANVFYELGIRHALRKRRTILIRGKPSADRIPFDLLTDSSEELVRRTFRACEEILQGAAISTDAWGTEYRSWWNDDPVSFCAGSAGPDGCWNTADDIAVLLWNDPRRPRLPSGFAVGQPEDNWFRVPLDG